MRHIQPEMLPARDEYALSAIRACQRAVKGELAAWVAEQEAKPDFDQDSPHWHHWQNLVADIRQHVDEKEAAIRRQNIKLVDDEEPPF
jgi:hypothetical protein